MGRINQYPKASAINGNDTLLGVVGGTTKQVAKDVLLSGVTNDISNTTIVGKKAGKLVTADDSSNNRLPEITAYGKSTQNTYSGKNELEISGISGTTTWRGITHTLNDDKSITLSGTATELIYIGLDYNTVLSVGESYTVSISKTAISGVQLAFGYFIADGTYTTIENGWVQTSKTVTIPSDYVKNRIVLQISSGATVNATIYPMIRKASITDDTYEPYTGGEASPNPSYPQDITSVAYDNNLVVKSVGKNHIENKGTTQSINGGTITVNEDKSITVKGTFTANTYYFISDYYYDLPIGEYILSGGNTSNDCRLIHYFYKKDNDKTYIGNIVDYGKAQNLNVNDNVWHRDNLYIPSGATVDTTIYPMIRPASIEDDTYEPYISSQASIGLADDLRGIPVTEGGNYTDANGQQWICDTIEKYADGTGKLVQRVYSEPITDVDRVSNYYIEYGAEVIVYLSRNIRKVDTEAVIISNKALGVPYNKRISLVGGRDDIYRVYYKELDYVTFRYPASVGEITLEQANADLVGGEVVYILAEPIETPLTAEQVAELEKLQTFEPYTTVSTDDIGEIAITYFKNSDSGKIVGSLNDRISNLVALLQSNGVI